MATVILCMDDLRGQKIARSTRFDGDPVALWQELLTEVGETRATAIWRVACNTYDQDHGEVIEHKPMLDPTWTEERGYAHALDLFVIAERAAAARKKEEHGIDQ